MQAEGLGEPGKGWGSSSMGYPGASGACLAGTTLAGSCWGTKLPGPGLQKATFTDYSPEASVLGLMGNTLSMASLRGLAAEKAIPLATAVLFPENTILRGT